MLMRSLAGAGTRPISIVETRQTGKKHRNTLCAPCVTATDNMARLFTLSEEQASHADVVYSDVSKILTSLSYEHAKQENKSVAENGFLHRLSI